MNESLFPCALIHHLPADQSSLVLVAGVEVVKTDQAIFCISFHFSLYNVPHDKDETKGDKIFKPLRHMVIVD